jgi:hypothetical protein
MKLDCQFVVGDKVQVRGHSEWGNLTVIAVDVIYTISDGVGLEDAYAGENLKSVSKCDHITGVFGVSENSVLIESISGLQGEGVSGEEISALVCGFCPLCGEKL